MLKLSAGIFVLIFNPLLEAQELKPQVSPFMQSWLKRSGVKSDFISYAVINVKTGEMLESFEEKNTMPLASVAKIFTAKYVIDILGEEATFQTQVLTQGKIKDGKLSGDLVIQGDGDPMLFTPDLAYLCEQLSAKKITSITGVFYYDDQYPFAKEEISLLGLGDEPYNSGISGLNINFNRFEFIHQGLEWSSLPPIESVKMKVTEHGFESGIKFLYDPIPQEFEQWKFEKKRKYSKRVELPMKRPGMHAAHFMQEQCKQFGIMLPPPTRWKPSPFKRYKGDILATHKSLPIKEIQRLALEYSNNLMAEASLLKAHATIINKNTTLRDSASHMIEHFQKKYPSLDWKSVSLINGSGLTSENSCSSLMLAQTLREMELETKKDRGLKTLLPLVGHSGWISERFKFPNLTHRMWAKTGSLDYVTNLAGYLVGKDGNTYAFALLYSDQAKRKYLDQFNDGQARSLTEQAPAHRRKISPRIDEILTHWLLKY